jgi:hypothetical protein
MSVKAAEQRERVMTTATRSVQIFVVEEEKL